jgi:hypothetical protein
MKHLVPLFVCVCLIGVFGQQPVHAIPLLQTYIEGAAYDTATESWVVDATGGSARLWVIGNVNGPGGAKGVPIVDVKVSAVYGSAFDGHITIGLTPTVIGGTGSFAGFTDAAAESSSGSLLRSGIDSTVELPTLWDGSVVPQHDAYKPGTHWAEFDIGTFDTSGDAIADFIAPADFPGPDPFDIFDIAEIKLSGAQINAYDILVSLDAGAPDVPLELHFDAYNHVQSSTMSRFAPFSHDSTSTSVVPEPASALVWLLIGVPCAIVCRYRRRRAN